MSCSACRTLKEIRSYGASQYPQHGAQPSVLVQLNAGLASLALIMLEHRHPCPMTVKYIKSVGLGLASLLGAVTACDRKLVIPSFPQASTLIDMTKADGEAAAIKAELEQWSLWAATWICNQNFETGLELDLALQGVLDMLMPGRGVIEGQPFPCLVDAIAQVRLSITDIQVGSGSSSQFPGPGAEITYRHRFYDLLNANSSDH